MQRAPAGPKVSSFQAAQVPIEPVTDMETLVGKLSFAVVARSAVRVPRMAAKAFLDVLKENEFTIEEKDFEEEPSRPPFHKSWILVAKTSGKASPASSAAASCSTSGRGSSPVSSARAAKRDPFAWMRNKRALDV